MSTVTLFVLLVLFGAVVLVARSVRLVRKGQVVLVDRLGIPHRTLRAGVHVLMPVVDSVAAEFLESSVHSTTQRIDAQTSDRRPVGLTLTVEYSSPTGSPADFSELVAQAITTDVSGMSSTDVRANDDRMLERYLLRVLDDAFRTRGMRALHLQLGSVTRP